MYSLYVDAVVLLARYVLSLSVCVELDTHTQTKYSIQDNFNILKILNTEI